MDEIDQSAKIVRQCVDRLSGKRPADDPVMIRDTKIGWPARLSLGPDGLGPSPEHIAHIMGGSMEALIHHFKLLTEVIADMIAAIASVDPVVGGVDR